MFGGNPGHPSDLEEDDLEMDEEVLQQLNVFAEILADMIINELTDENELI